MEIYFKQDCSKADWLKVESFQRLETILFDNLNIPVFMVIRGIHYVIKNIHNVKRPFKLVNPKIYYYCQNPEGESIAKLPGEEQEDVISRELTITNIQDLEYFINHYQGKQYILDIKYTSFVIHKLEDS